MANKYNAKKVRLDGLTFDSKAEARRYQELKLLEQAGEISDLEIHPRYEIIINGVKVCNYIADFRYMSDGEQVVEDVKGVKTAVYRLKNKLMLAVHNIEILETR